MDYSWVTQEMFDDKLEEIYRREGLDLHEVYDIAVDVFNNQVLEELQEEREES